MDRSLVLLSAVVVISLASAVAWHWIVKSFALAVIGSTLTVGLTTYLGYPMVRGVDADAFIVVNALVLGAIIAIGVGIPFRRRRRGFNPTR